MEKKSNLTIDIFLQLRYNVQIFNININIKYYESTAGKNL